MTEEEARQYVRNVLGGKKNAAGKGTTGGIRESLVSALKRGNTAKRNEILGKYAVAHGAPAAAAVAAGVAVADAVVKNNTKKKNKKTTTSTERRNAKIFINAALAAAGSTRKINPTKAATFAKLKMDGKQNNADAYLKAILNAAAEKGAEAAAKAVAKEAEKEAKAAAKAAGDTSAEIKAKLEEAGSRSTIFNVQVYRKAKLAGASDSAAIAAVRKSISNAAKKSAATRKALKNGRAAAAAAAPAPAAAAVAALAGKNNEAKNARNIELLMSRPKVKKN